jgi:nucleoid-associated protein YgaU
MNRKFYSVLLIALLLGIQPVLAQDEGEIDLGAASDDEMSQALETSSDIEVANENDAVEIPSGEVPLAETSGEVEPVLAAEAPSEEETPADEEPALAEEVPSEEEAPLRPSATITEKDIPNSIRFNRYFLESQRLAKLAQETYDYGDYDASINFAQEAIHYAMLSDVYVAIAIAKSRIDWAVASGASKQYPVEFREAETWYNESLSARDAEEWENAIEAAHKVIDILAYISSPEGTFALPARYTVRTWITVKDCFWNIAGRPWVYGNPHQWRVLYNANKSKLPDPNNPNLIEPGMVLEIPSIRGETRQGEWSSNRTYPSIR